MATGAEPSAQLQALFTATPNHPAQRGGFVRRTSKLSGSVLAQAPVFGWLA